MIRSFWKIAGLVILAFPLGQTARASEPGVPWIPVPATPEGLGRLTVGQLDAVFGCGSVGVLPVGLGSGRVLVRTDTRMPQARARLQSLVWKGKFFRCDGTFTNQWLGFRAVDSVVQLGTSWYDGQPCILLDYPPDAPVFGNARDELREIAPGVLLGRFYERCPQPKLQGYFVLVMQPDHK